MDAWKNSTVVLISPGHNDPADVKSQLIKFGFTVCSASNFEEAEKLYSDIKSGAIVIDIDMFESLKSSISFIKSTISCINHLPVIVISSKDDLKLKLRIFKLGAADYMVKPFDVKELYVRLNIHINKLKANQRMNKKISELEKKNEALKKLATIDALTGLYNKRYILDRLCSEVSRSARFSEPISFIMIDIDFFKRINDRYGHPAGDKLLSEIADIIKLCVRNIDIPARYGGEEFLIACPNTDSAGANIIAERLRKKIQSTKFRLKDNIINITLSIGIRSSLLNPAANMNNVVLKLIDEADKALYLAKAKGRNRAETYMDNDEYILNMPEKISYRLKQGKISPNIYVQV